MKFPRNAKIFRGPGDMAPFVSVFFLSLIFILLASLISVPGIPLQIVNSPNAIPKTSKEVITISREGDISFRGEKYNLGSLDRLRIELKKLPEEAHVTLRAESGAPKQIVSALREMGRRGLELPEADGMEGTDNPTLYVTIDIGGQLYYENQLIRPDDLKRVLANEVTKNHGPLTLVIFSDKEVTLQTFDAVLEIAKQAGIQEVLGGTRPRMRNQADARKAE